MARHLSLSTAKVSPPTLNNNNRSPRILLLIPCSRISLTIRPGNDLYRASFGSRTVDRSEPLTPDTLTWIASQTKLATSVAAMQVVEKGLIGLDDDVREVLPVLKDLKVLVRIDGDDGATAADEASFDVIAKGGAVDRSEQPKPKGTPVYEDIQGKITLRLVIYMPPLLLARPSPALFQCGRRRGTRF